MAPKTNELSVWTRAIGVVILFVVAQFAGGCDESQSQAVSSGLSKRLPAKGPNEFDGVPWGASEKDARALVWKHLDKNQRELSSWQCSDDNTVDGCLRCDYMGYRFAENVPAEMVSLYFMKGSFQSVYISWQHRDWEFVRHTFRERFGEPTHTGAQMLQNAMGATFASESESWQWNGASLRIREYADRIDKSSATMETDAFGRAAEASHAQRLKDAAAKF
jgi:hypothetical protein